MSFLTGKILVQHQLRTEPGSTTELKNLNRVFSTNVFWALFVSIKIDSSRKSHVVIIFHI